MLRVIINIVGILVYVSYAVAAVLLAIRFFGKSAKWIGTALGAAWGTGWVAVFVIWIIGLVITGSLEIIVLGASAILLPLLPGIVKPNEKPDKPWLMAVCLLAVLLGWMAGIILAHVVR